MFRNTSHHDRQSRPDQFPDRAATTMCDGSQARQRLMNDLGARLRRGAIPLDLALCLVADPLDKFNTIDQCPIVASPPGQSLACSDHRRDRT
jgi:hypothetical protein